MIRRSKRRKNRTRILMSLLLSTFFFINLSLLISPGLQHMLTRVTHGDAAGSKFCLFFPPDSSSLFHPHLHTYLLPLSSLDCLFFCHSSYVVASFSLSLSLSLSLTPSVSLSLSLSPLPSLFLSVPLNLFLSISLSFSQ